MSLMANEFLYHGSNQVVEHPICDMGAKRMVNVEF